MRMKVFASLRSKLLKPCKKLFPIFRLRLKNPVYIRAPRAVLARKKRKPVSGILGGLLSSRRKAKETMEGQLGSFSDNSMLFRPPPPPSPLLPGKRVDDEVEDSCRSFENYLVEMIVEEGKLRDLTDVEELLYCWKNLKCPVFIDLVTRFYGELCRDLFSAEPHHLDSPL